MRIRHLIALLLVLGLSTAGAMAASYNVPVVSDTNSTGYTDYASKNNGEVLVYGGAVTGTTRAQHGYFKFDTSGLSDAMDITAVEFHFYVNDTEWPYWSVTPVTNDPSGFGGADAATMWDDIAAEATDGYYALQDEEETYAAGWKAIQLADFAETDIETLLPSDYFLLGAATRDTSATYYLEIDGHLDPNTPYLVVFDDPAPANDTCAGAPVVPSGEGLYVYTGDTTYASNDYDADSCFGTLGHNGPDVAYEVTVPGNCRVCPTLYQSTMTWNGGVYLIEDCADSAGTCLAGASGWLTGGDDETFCYEDTQTKTYYIIVDGRDGGGAGAFTLDVIVSCLVGPSGLACVDNDTSIDLSWTNNGTYDTIEVYEDGELIDTIAGTATTYNYVPAKGYHCYYVCGTTVLDRQCSDECCLIYGYDNQEVLWDFEGDPGGFVVDGTGFWEHGEGTYGPCATPGNDVWSTVLNGDYHDLACWVLDSAPIDMGEKGAFLCFDHCYETEATFDGGAVWFTTDDYWYYTWSPIGGGTEQFLGNPGCQWASERFGFTGSSGGWVTDCWDLTDPMWFNESAKIRWAFAADISDVGGAGWSIDNVTIYNNNVVGTYSCDYTVLPSTGTLAFPVSHRITLTNLLSGTPHWTRRIAARIDVTLGNGVSVSNWKSGYTGVAPGVSFVTSFPVNFALQARFVGTNTFVLTTEDVSPSPYNQPPYPASGDTCTVVNDVVASAP